MACTTSFEEWIKEMGNSRNDCDDVIDKFDVSKGNMFF